MTDYSNNKPLLEIAVGNLHGALVAQQAGAHRIELCDNLREGGTTPSYGYLQQARGLLHIPVYPIVRPRGGDFLYSEAEFETMLADVQLCKQLGYEGVVVGCLLADGRVDEERTKRLVELAWPMGVTFHRAFDRSRDAFEALEAVIACGCERILTSGQVPAAPDGALLIRQLVEKADGRISIMPGSGVRAANLAALMKTVGANEYHSSAKNTAASEMHYHNPLMGAADGGFDGVDAQEIKNMLAILQNN
jgi:copper homeostasis protein